MPIRQISGEATVLTANIEGLYTRRNKHKVDLLHWLAKEKDTIMVALTETHLRSEICDAEVQMTGFHLIRQDRTEGFLRGGVAIYLREDLLGDMSIISSGSNDVVEWLVIYLESKRMVFGCLYRPPSCHANNI